MINAYTGQRANFVSYDPLPCFTKKTYSKCSDKSSVFRTTGKFFLKLIFDISLDKLEFFSSNAKKVI